MIRTMPAQDFYIKDNHDIIGWVSKVLVPNNI